MIINKLKEGDRLPYQPPTITKRGNIKILTKLMVASAGIQDPDGDGIFDEIFLPLAGGESLVYQVNDLIKEGPADVLDIDGDGTPDQIVFNLPKN